MPLINKRNLFFGKARGFTLLEVLITLIIMSIGLLGLAALQISSLRNNHSAEHRGQATELARSMSDRMRANAFYVRALNGGLYGTLDEKTATETTSCSALNPCASDILAENDLFEWNRFIEAVLPGGDASIARTGDGSTAVYTISVRWLDVSGGDRSTLNPGFEMEFQP